jgi:hypothetical protein
MSRGDLNRKIQLLRNKDPGIKADRGRKPDSESREMISTIKIRWYGRDGFHYKRSLESMFRE